MMGILVADIASQLPALIGVVVGAGLSYGGSALTERNKRRRSQEVRWDSRRVEAYSRYAVAVKRQTRLCQRIAAAQGLGPRSDPLEIAEAEVLLAEAREERSGALEAVLLLGDNATVSAARDWYYAASDLYHLLADTEATETQFLDFYRQAGVQRDRFYAAARTAFRLVRSAFGRHRRLLRGGHSISRQADRMHVAAVMGVTEILGAAITQAV